VIFSSHVLAEVEQVCDRVIMLRAGQLVHDQVMAELRRQHRIRARLNSTLPAIPDDLQPHVKLGAQQNGFVTLEAPGELAPLLGWLATLPVTEMQIEPLGLQSVYDKYHAAVTND
jgi:ABC-2 type transport system ATP-binding protein